MEITSLEVTRLKTMPDRGGVQVLEMLENGETPPGIRDVNDMPPDPAAPPPPARLAPRPKPWERAAAGPPPGAPACKCFMCRSRRVFRKNVRSVAR